MGHATGPPLSTVGLNQVTLWAMQQVRLYLQWDKSGDLVGHSTGPSLSPIRLSQVTVWAMQQVGLDVKCD